MPPSLTELFEKLHVHFGPQQWWPADSPFEVIVGAILTQNTNWTNVEKAIANLKQADALDIESITSLPQEKLEELIRPSGFFRQKAVRLKHFTRVLIENYDGHLDRLFALDNDGLRTTLLALPGIGPETADSILLYAADRPSFVVDAYTHRILERLGIQQGKQNYEQTRSLFMRKLPAETDLFNEYHALIVQLGKQFCRKSKPRCSDCPLLSCCRFGNSTTKD